MFNLRNLKIFRIKSLNFQNPLLEELHCCYLNCVCIYIILMMFSMAHWYNGTYKIIITIRQYSISHVTYHLGRWTVMAIAFLSCVLGYAEQ